MNTRTTKLIQLALSAFGLVLVSTSIHNLVQQFGASVWWLELAHSLIMLAGGIFVIVILKR